jgi:hypothetical protein
VRSAPCPLGFVQPGPLQGEGALPANAEPERGVVLRHRLRLGKRQPQNPQGAVAQQQRHVGPDGRLAVGERPLRREPAKARGHLRRGPDEEARRLAAGRAHPRRRVQRDRLPRRRRTRGDALGRDHRERGAVVGREGEHAGAGAKRRQALLHGGGRHLHGARGFGEGGRDKLQLAEPCRRALGARPGDLLLHE